MSAQLPISLVVSWDASGVVSGASQTAAGLQEINKDAKGAAASLDSYNAATVEAAEAARQATDVLTGQTAAQKALQAAAATAGSARAGEIAVVRTMTGAVHAQTSAFALNRAGMMELRASGINAFQALAAGMSITQVAMMEGSQVIGAAIQGTEGGVKGLLSSLAGVGSGILSTFGVFPIVSIGAIAAVVGVYEAVTKLDDWITHTSADAKEFDSWLQKIGSSANTTSAFIDKVAKAIKEMSIVDLNKLTRGSSADITKLREQLTNPLAQIAGTEGVLNDPAFVQTYQEIDSIIGKLKGDGYSSLEDLRHALDDVVSTHPQLQRFAEVWETIGEAMIKAKEAAQQADLAIHGYAFYQPRTSFADNGSGALQQTVVQKVGDAQLSPYAAALKNEIASLEDQLNKYGLAATDAEIRNSAIQIVGASYLRQPSSYSFSAAQAPEQYRRALLQTFDPNLIASIIQTESSWNPSAYNSKYGAAGLGQFIPGTAKALGIDPYNADQAIGGVSTYLQQLLGRYNGNQYAAVAAYGGASKGDIGRILSGQAPLNPAVQDYLDKIFNPGPGVEQQLATFKAWDQQIDAATGSLKVQQGVYGQSFQAMDEAARYQGMLNDAIRSNTKITPQLTDHMHQVAAALAAVDQAAANAQFMKDLQFQRDQLGRTQDEQQVYSDLRQRQIDINTPAGQAAAAADRATIALSNMKSMASDAFNTLVGDLQAGANGWKIFEDVTLDVLNNIVKKLEDRLISSLFGGGTGSGGGFFDWLFGGGWGGGNISDTALTAITNGNGGLYDVGGFTGGGDPRRVAGLVHEEEYVFSAPAVRAIGVGKLDAMHRAAKSGRGFAEGGYTMPWAGSSFGSAGGSSGGNLSINITNNGEPVDATAHQTVDGNGNRQIDIMLNKKIDDRVLRPSSPANRRLRDMGLKVPVTIR